MKKIITLFLVLSILLTLSACTQNETGLTTPTERIAAGDFDSQTPPPSNPATSVPDTTPNDTGTPQNDNGKDNTPTTLTPAITVVETTSAVYEKVGRYPNEAAVTRRLVDGEWQFALVDRTGKVTILNGYEDVYDFSDGLAAVEAQTSAGRRWGFVDTAGNEVISPMYNGVGEIYAIDAIPGFSGGAAWVTKGNGNWIIIDTQGNEFVPSFGATAHGRTAFNKGVSMVAVNGQYGIIDKMGQEVVPLGVYYQMNEFSEVLAVVQRMGTQGFGFIDNTGKEVIWLSEFDFSRVSGFSDGVSWVYDGDTQKYGLIDKTGNVLIPPTFPHPGSNLGIFVDGVSVVYRDEEWGVIDKQGNEVVPFGKYEEIRNGFSDGLAEVRLNGVSGFIDTAGNEVLQPQYNGVRQPFSDGVAVVMSAEDRNMPLLIDKMGNVLYAGNDITYLGNGWATYQENNLKGILRIVSN